VIISSSRRFIFVHTMKTAGDSITRDLKPYLARGDFVIQNDFQAWMQRAAHRTDPRLRSLVKHSAAEAIKHAVDPDAWESSYKFAFVRHPAERALSLYRFAAMKEEERRQPHIRNLWYSTPPGKKDDPDSWPAIVAFRESDSFSGFIRHPALSAAVGMQPRSEFLCDSDGRLLVDVVGKFERLNEDMATVRQSLGLPDGALSRVNSSRPAARGDGEISLDDRRFLADLFEGDYLLFGYE
jgi:hypothetical protein